MLVVSVGLPARVRSRRIEDEERQKRLNLVGRNELLLLVAEDEEDDEVEDVVVLLVVEGIVLRLKMFMNLVTPR